jgi:hypothetical protein
LSLIPGAAEVARKIVDEGGQVSLQGPGDDHSHVATLLYRDADDVKARLSGWYVWGKTRLFDEPENPEEN